MTLHQLEIFGAVVRYLNVTRAAREIRISQPTVSKQLKHLQEEFHAKFYLKMGRGVKLTEDGNNFWEAVSPILQGLVDLKKTFLAAGSKSVSLTVGGTQSPSAFLLPEALKSFKLTHPAVHPTLRTGNSPMLEEMVLNSEAEIAVVTKPSYHSRLITEPFCSEPIVAAVSAKHPLARKKKLTSNELREAPFIVRTGGTIAKELEKRGIKLNPHIRCSSSEAVKSAVQSGVGIGLFYRDEIQIGVRERYLKKIEIAGLDDMSVRWYIVYRKGIPLAPLARSFLALLHRIRKAH